MTLQDKIEQTNAIADAIQRNERNYTLDVKSDDTWNTDTINIELPTPQRTGTMVQRQSYAMGKAMELLNYLTK